jgi:hypothetical protein
MSLLSVRRPSDKVRFKFKDCDASRARQSRAFICALDGLNQRFADRMHQALLGRAAAKRAGKLELNTSLAPAPIADVLWVHRAKAMAIGFDANSGLPKPLSYIGFTDRVHQ